MCVYVLEYSNFHTFSNPKIKQSKSIDLIDEFVREREKERERVKPSFCIFLIYVCVSVCLFVFKRQKFVMISKIENRFDLYIILYIFKLRKKRFFLFLTVYFFLHPRRLYNVIILFALCFRLSTHTHIIYIDNLNVM